MKFYEMSYEQIVAGLDYNPDTGVIKIVDHSVSVFSKVDSVESKGYLRCRVKRGDDVSMYIKAHRLVWFYTYKAWPPKFIDHINGVRNDNRISNLRLADHGQNQANRRKDCDGLAPYKGITYNKRCKKWQAQITKAQKTIYLGLYSDPLEAAKVYEAASKEYHGEYARAWV